MLSDDISLTFNHQRGFWVGGGGTIQPAPKKRPIVLNKLSKQSFLVFLQSTPRLFFETGVWRSS